jgi:hypothetical protein
MCDQPHHQQCYQCRERSKKVVSDVHGGLGLVEKSWIKPYRLIGVG